MLVFNLLLWEWLVIQFGVGIYNTCSLLRWLYISDIVSLCLGALTMSSSWMPPPRHHSLAHSPLNQWHLWHRVPLPGTAVTTAAPRAARLGHVTAISGLHLCEQLASPVAQKLPLLVFTPYRLISRRLREANLSFSCTRHKRRVPLGLVSHFGPVRHE